LVAVVVLVTLKWPDGSVLPRLMVLPGRGVPLAVRVPERVKGWLVAGVVVLAVMVRVVGVRVVVAVTTLVGADEATLAPTWVARTLDGDAFPAETVDRFF